jgi:hypothetical protein
MKLDGDLLIERGARVLHKVGGGAAWSDLAPTLKERRREAARTIFAYIDLCLDRIDAHASSATSKPPLS